MTDAQDSAQGRALHLIKLCVGAESIADLEEWQQSRAAERIGRNLDPRPFHVTRMTPRRSDELLEGGSLYWVIRGVVSVRQQILALEEVTGEDGASRCKIVLDPKLVRVEGQPRRPFQGWRYLTGSDAPRDIDGAPRNRPDAAMLPQELQEEIARYGVA